MSVGSLAFSPTDEDEDFNYFLQLEDLRATVSTGRVAMKARRASLGQTVDVGSVDHVFCDNNSQHSFTRSELSFTPEQSRNCN